MAVITLEVTLPLEAKYPCKTCDIRSFSIELSSTFFQCWCNSSAFETQNADCKLNHVNGFVEFMGSQLRKKATGIKKQRAPKYCVSRR